MGTGAAEYATTLDLKKPVDFRVIVICADVLLVAH